MKKNYERNLRSQRGITLIALVITIIVLLILAGVTIATLIGENGILTQAEKAKVQTEKAAIKERIEVESIALTNDRNLNTKTDKEILELLKNNLDIDGAEYLISSKFMVITTKEGYIFTVLYDGTVLEGRLAYLDIADGTIQLYSNGYKQNGGNLQEYQGNYVITGTSRENTVKVMDIGTYNITIKDLSIDVSLIDRQCAFNANRGAKATDCFVNLTLEGENYLTGGSSAAALGFGKATPNVDGVTNGSTLTINGSGKLETVGGSYSAGIGCGYTGFEAAQGPVSNIIINSGTIIARGGANGCGIGSSWGGDVNNLVINGGNINVDNTNAMRYAIGATGTLDNLVINGGTITAIGYTYCGAIGGGTGSGKIKINGGTIFAYAPSKPQYAKCHGIGQGCEIVEINGGTIVSKSDYCAGIFSTSGNIKINGGTIFAIESEIPIGKLGDDGTTLENCIPTNGTDNLYLTPIQLENVTEKLKVTSLTISDNINYGITDMYTSEDNETTDVNEGGILYLYLPKGDRTITIVAGDKKYTNRVITDENNTITILNGQ